MKKKRKHLGFKCEIRNLVWNTFLLNGNPIRVILSDSSVFKDIVDLKEYEQCKNFGNERKVKDSNNKYSLEIFFVYILSAAVTRINFYFLGILIL